MELLITAGLLGLFGVPMKVSAKSEKLPPGSGVHLVNGVHAVFAVLAVSRLLVCVASERADQRELERRWVEAVKLGALARDVDELPVPSANIGCGRVVMCNSLKLANGGTLTRPRRSAWRKDLWPLRARERWHATIPPRDGLGGSKLRCRAKTVEFIASSPSARVGRELRSNPP